jgi:hypothetical protein
MTFASQAARGILLAGVLSLVACVSEDWDSPYDTQGSTYQAPCKDAPDWLEEQCVFWTDFSSGLAGWKADQPANVEPPRILAQAGSAEHVLELAACDERAANVRREIAFPAGRMRMAVAYRDADGPAGKLGMNLDGAALLFQTGSPGSGAAGWTEAVTFLESPRGKVLVLEVFNANGAEGCSRLWVDRISIELLQ